VDMLWYLAIAAAWFLAGWYFRGYALRSEVMRRQRQGGDQTP